MKPRLLDLFCGAGGATKGYQRAGFHVTGVDIAPQPRYCGDNFHQADALTFSLDGYDAIHASPPCQSYSRAIRHLSRPTEQLIDPIRELLQEARLPYVIENVPGSPLPRQDTLDGRHGVELCGSMFGLRVQRHRLFETSFPIPAFRSCNHSRPALNPYNANARRRDGIERNATQHHAAAMQVAWMRGDEIGEAIPPVYTELIGTKLMAHLKATVAA